MYCTTGSPYLVDVSLRLQGVTLSSDSLVDIDDILQFPDSSTTTPANNNEHHNQSLLCLTDLEDCCNDPRTAQGEWYYPDGNTVGSFGENEFQRNRGANEVMNDRQFYGSVRLFPVRAIHLREVVSIVSYPMQLTHLLAKFFMQTYVS